MTLKSDLNRLAGTSGLDEQGAANAWAGTSGQSLQGALNTKAGTSGWSTQKALNIIAGSSGVAENGVLVGYGFNLLTTNQASAETNLAGLQSDGPVSATLAQTAVQALVGTKSVQLTSTGAGNIAVSTGATKNACKAGVTYSAVASGRSAVTSRQFTCQIWFFDSSNTFVGSGTGNSVATTTTGWVTSTVTAVAPATAEKVICVAYFTAAVLNEVHYADKLGLFQGAYTTWNLP